MFFGTKDQFVPVATAKAFQAGMERCGVRCETIFFEGQEHGFFNHERLPGLLFIRSINRFFQRSRLACIDRRSRPGGLRYVAALLLLLALPLFPAQRPRYGGVLRIEVRLAGETPDPPSFLSTGFNITRWEAGRRAVYEADESAPGGR